VTVATVTRPQERAKTRNGYGNSRTTGGFDGISRQGSWLGDADGRARWGGKLNDIGLMFPDHSGAPRVLTATNERRYDYFGTSESPSNLYALLAISQSMSNAFMTYHQAQLLRLLSLLIVFGVLVPGLWFLVRPGLRSVGRFARLENRERRQPRGEIS
jgi:hypothetical protein